MQKCPKCGQDRGYWKEVWLADIGVALKEWVHHTCTGDSEVTVATSE